MRSIVALGTVLLSSNFLLVSPLLAQSDASGCFLQDSSGRTINLGHLCGGAPQRSGNTQPNLSYPAQNQSGISTKVRQAECKKLLETIQKNWVQPKMVDGPTTKAQREKNIRAAKQYEQAANTIRSVKFTDAPIQEMQLMAVHILSDGAKLALAINQVGPHVTQNAAFGLSFVAGQMAMGAVHLEDQYQKNCGAPLKL